jgi:hypothetical protein
LEDAPLIIEAIQAVLKKSHTTPKKPERFQKFVSRRPIGYGYPERSNWPAKGLKASVNTSAGKYIPKTTTKRKKAVQFIQSEKTQEDEENKSSEE